MRSPGILVILLLAPLSCTATGPRAANVVREPVLLATSRPDVQVVVVSDAWRRPAESARTPWLQWVVYGPDRPARAIGLRNPQGVAVRGNDLLICDQGFPDAPAVDLQTGRVRRWIQRPHGPVCPVDIAVGTDNRVYVADTTRCAVLEYTESGRFERAISPPDAGPKGFRPASVLAIDKTLYIGDPVAHLIHRYDASQGVWNAPLPMTGLPSALVAPVGLARSREGNLLIADAVVGMVYEVSITGEWVRSIGARGRGPCQFVRPMHVTVTDSGYLFVSDAGKQTVSIFDSGASCLVEVGASDGGPPNVQLALPTGLAAIASAAGGAMTESSLARTGHPVREWVAVTDPLGEVSLRWIGILETSKSP